LIRNIVIEVLGALDDEFARACAATGRPSIAPERAVADERRLQAARPPRSANA
jgi:hypothetical protein